MAKSSPLLEYLVDHLAPLGGARGRAMFGGFGVYLDGFIIGIIAFDTFYLKADETNRPAFEAAGSQPFTYRQGKHTATITAYWECPADVLEEPEQLRSWAATSLSVSRQAKKPADPKPLHRTPTPKTTRKKNKR